jgi:UDP-glucose 4-epimerase
MSTVKVYGESTTNSDPWDEGSKCLPEDAYGKSKLEAEKLIRKLEDDNFKVSIIRAPLIYGPGVKGNLISILKLVNKFPILPLGNIKNKRSMVYVGNIIELIKHIIKTSKSGVFLGGDNRVLSTTELCQIVAKGLNKKLILISIPNLFICMAKKIKPNIIERLWGSLEINNHITNQTLVFTPPYSVEYGMAEMICWFKSIKKSNGRIL